MDVNTEVAIQVLYLFQVHEIKEKENVKVYKLCLVCDASRKKTAITTYTSNLYREDWLILIHLCAALDLEYCHTD